MYVLNVDTKVCRMRSISLNNLYLVTSQSLYYGLTLSVELDNYLEWKLIII